MKDICSAVTEWSELWVEIEIIGLMRKAALQALLDGSRSV